MYALINNWIDYSLKGLYKEFNEDFNKLKSAFGSYIENYNNEFGVEKDYFHLRGEDNIFRYIPLNTVALRVSKDDTLFEILSRILAAHICGVQLHVSVGYDESSAISFLFENKETLLNKNDKILRESEEEFIQNFKNVDRIIYSDISKVTPLVFREAAKIAKFIVRQKPMMEGRIELLNYMQEQSISYSYHRYGNLGARGIDKQ